MPRVREGPQRPLEAHADGPRTVQEEDQDTQGGAGPHLQRAAGGERHQRQRQRQRQEGQEGQGGVDVVVVVVVRGLGVEAGDAGGGQGGGREVRGAIY